MDKKLFEGLVKGIRQAGKIKRGETYPSRMFDYTSLDVQKIREKTGLSQNDFAMLVHISPRTLQNWEQGRRSPQGPAIALLTILKNNPKLAISALNKKF